MTRASSGVDSRATDLVYCGIAVVAAVLTLVGEQFQPLLAVAVAASLVPWVLIAVGVRVPYPLFAVLAITPLIPVVVTTGIGSAIFLTLAAASRIASRSDQRWLVAVVTAVVVVLPFTAWIFGFDEWDDGAVYFAFGGAFGVLVGLLLRRSTRLAEELRRADAELVAAAAREERHRIARDVHDLVAHSLTVVVLHVGGARRVLRTDPDAAEAALADAEQVSRESLDAIRGVVGLLREDDDPDVASLDLDRLVTTYRSAGLAVVLSADEAVATLPLSVRVTLYRVIQEALANAARHGPPDAAATVELRVDGQLVIATIENPVATASGPTRAADATAGYGLVGLREQAASLGGQLVSGPRGGAWVVECRLPIGGVS